MRARAPLEKRQAAAAGAAIRQSTLVVHVEGSCTLNGLYIHLSLSHFPFFFILPSKGRAFTGVVLERHERDAAPVPDCHHCTPDERCTGRKALRSTLALAQFRWAHDTLDFFVPHALPLLHS